MTVFERFQWGVDRETETATWSRMVAGALFATAAGWFITAMMLAGSMVPGYELQPSTISQLGVEPESAFLFNGSLLGGGVITGVGGVLFYRSHRTRWLLACFALAGLGAFGAGIFPLNFGPLHSLFALLAFLFYNVAAIGTGVRIRGPMVIVSVLLGTLGLIFLGIMIVGDLGNPSVFGPIGHGGAERMIVYPAMLWLLVFGGYMLASDRRRSRLAEPVAESDARTES